MADVMVFRKLWNIVSCGDECLEMFKICKCFVVYLNVEGPFGLSVVHSRIDVDANYP